MSECKFDQFNPTYCTAHQRWEVDCLRADRDRYKKALEYVVMKLAAWDRFREVGQVVDEALYPRALEKKEAGTNEKEQG